MHLKKTSSCEGIPYVKSATSMYNAKNINKHYISIDLVKANYQALKSFHKEAVLYTNTWEELMSKFTDMEYFKNSKYIRQVIFGNLSDNTIKSQQVFLTEIVLLWLINKGYPKDKIMMYTTDEIFVECQPQMFFGERSINFIEKEIYESTGIEVHIEDFILKYIGNNAYMKQHENSLPTFKCLPNIFYPQVIKAYMDNEITYKDLLFSYEGIPAKFISPLTWDFDNSPSHDTDIS